jgi:hypothetical protein
VFRLTAQGLLADVRSPFAVFKPRQRPGGTLSIHVPFVQGLVRLDTGRASHFGLGKRSTNASLLHTQRPPQGLEGLQGGEIGSLRKLLAQPLQSDANTIQRLGRCAACVFGGGTGSCRLQHLCPARIRFITA